MDFKKIEWSNNLSIGNTNIDDDHKKLFEIYNNLIDLIELNKSRKEFAEILSKMTDYALKHFKKEEIYMHEFSYPKLAEHQKYHRDYKYKVAMYNVDLLGTNPPRPEEIINFLKKWWLNHIMNSDVEYENYKKEIKSDTKYSTL